jgi:hypothetical protein
MDLKFVGVKSFRTGGSEGMTTAFFGSLAEASEELLPLAVYGCKGCGRIELFLPTEPEG